MVSPRAVRWIKIIIIVLAFIAVQALLTSYVSAADDSINGTYIIETIGDALASFLGRAAPTPEAPIPYIYQGDTVYLDTHIDISGVVPPYPQLAYWDGFDMYDTPPKYNITLDFDDEDAYYKFYVDPEIFKTRTGRWYKYGGEYEKRGNNLAFIVSPLRYANYTLRFPNGTIVNLSAELNPSDYSNVTGRNIKSTAPLLPERHVADYVLAKGDELVWPNGGYRLWLFGRIDGVYDHRDNVINVSEIETLENGKYTVGVQVAGNNTVYEANCGYEPNTTLTCDTLYPGLYGKAPVSLLGTSPTLALQRMKDMLNGTDDSLYEYTLDLDNPYITIRRADEMMYLDKKVLDVRGYTNVANGTEITVSLDEKDQRDYIAKTVAIRTSPGNLSYYRAYVPLNYDELAADARNHTLTARTALGGWMEKDFKISVMPADSYRPNATLKYIEGRNPYVAPPTPKVVTQIVTQVVTEYVTVEVTPPPSMVYEQQKKVEQERWDANVSLVLIGIGAVAIFVIIIGAFWYAASVYRRGRKNAGR